MVVLYILLALVILLLMVVIHEFGHYIAGKILKFKINEFSVGFGPKIFSRARKNGEVISLRAVPLGGYCAFEGETEQPDDPNGKSFMKEKPWKRIIVLISGGVANLLSAIVFSLIFIWAVGFTVPTVGQVYTDTDGAVFNPLIKDDVIVAVNGREIGIMTPYEELIGGLKEGDSATLTVERKGNRIDVVVTKQKIVTNDTDLNGEPIDPYVGMGYSSVSDFVKPGFLYSLKYCVPYMFRLSWMIIGTFGDLIIGKIPITELAGPAGTIAMMADLSRVNWRNIFILLPLIASNLGIFNLLPIPALDGSKVVFTIVEWIRGKPINQKVENTIHTVGIILLFALVIILDLIRFLTPVFK